MADAMRRSVIPGILGIAASCSSVMVVASVVAIILAVSLSFKSDFLTPLSLKNFFHSGGTLSIWKPLLSSQPTCVMCLKLVGAEMTISGGPLPPPPFSLLSLSRALACFISKLYLSLASFSFLASSLLLPFFADFGAMTGIFLINSFASAVLSKHAPITSSNSKMWKLCVPRLVLSDW